MRYELKNVYVKSYQINSSTNTDPAEDAFVFRSGQGDEPPVEEPILPPADRSPDLGDTLGLHEEHAVRQLFENAVLDFALTGDDDF